MWIHLVNGAVLAISYLCIRHWGRKKDLKRIRELEETNESLICEINALQMEIKAKLHSAEKIAEEEVKEKFQRMEMDYSVALCKEKSKNAKILCTVFKVVEMLQKMLEEK